MHCATVIQFRENTLGGLPNGAKDQCQASGLSYSCHRDSETTVIYAFYRFSKVMLMHRYWALFHRARLGLTSCVSCGLSTVTMSGRWNQLFGTAIVQWRRWLSGQLSGLCCYSCRRGEPDTDTNYQWVEDYKSCQVKQWHTFLCQGRRVRTHASAENV